MGCYKDSKEERKTVNVGPKDRQLERVAWSLRQNWLDCIKIFIGCNNSI